MTSDLFKKTANTSRTARVGFIFVSVRSFWRNVTEKKLSMIFWIFRKSMSHWILNSSGAPLSLEVNFLILMNSKFKVGIFGFSRSLITILIRKKCFVIELKWKLWIFMIFTFLKYGTSHFLGFQAHWSRFLQWKV